jgi:integrase
MGDRPVAVVDTGDVTAALEPIWTAKPETASRLRGRIEAVLDFAKARGWREGENPARWRGHLKNLLPARAKIARVKHHAALAYIEVGEFMAELRRQEGVAAQALQFTILTAARTGEIIGARWLEIDRARQLWSVPAERMKGGREHRVPLSDAALAVLDKMGKLRDDKAQDAFVFPGGRAENGLSNMGMATVLKRMSRDDITVHGFRSCFRDWAAETTSYAREVAEAALAHTLSDKVEAAYRRGDLLAKRARLMDDWAAYCLRPKKAAGVVPINSGRRR